MCVVRPYIKCDMPGPLTKLTAALQKLFPAHTHRPDWASGEIEICLHINIIMEYNYVVTSLPIVQPHCHTKQAAASPVFKAKRTEDNCNHCTGLDCIV